MLDHVQGMAKQLAHCSGPRWRGQQCWNPARALLTSHVSTFPEDGELCSTHAAATSNLGPCLWGCARPGGASSSNSLEGSMTVVTSVSERSPVTSSPAQGPRQPYRVCFCHMATGDRPFLCQSSHTGLLTGCFSTTTEVPHLIPNYFPWNPVAPLPSSFLRLYAIFSLTAEHPPSTLPFIFIHSTCLLKYLIIYLYTGSGTNNTPLLLQNLLLQNHKHVIL